MTPWEDPDGVLSSWLLSGSFPCVLWSLRVTQYTDLYVSLSASKTSIYKKAVFCLHINSFVEASNCIFKVLGFLVPITDSLLSLSAGFLNHHDWSYCHCFFEPLLTG